MFLAILMGDDAWLSGDEMEKTSGWHNLDQLGHQKTGAIFLLSWLLKNTSICVCLKMGYTPNYSHLVGIMMIKHWVIGYTIFRQTHISRRFPAIVWDDSGGYPMLKPWGAGFHFPRPETTEPRARDGAREMTGGDPGVSSNHGRNDPGMKWNAGNWDSKYV